MDIVQKGERGSTANLLVWRGGAEQNAQGALNSLAERTFLRRTTFLAANPWLSVTHCLPKSDFWNLRPIWSEWCLDAKTKRQKDKKRQKKEDIKTKKVNKTKGQKKKETKRQKDKKKKDKKTRWQYDKMTKWPNYIMTIWQNGKMTKRQKGQAKKRQKGQKNDKKAVWCCDIRAVTHNCNVLFCIIEYAFYRDCDAGGDVYLLKMDLEIQTARIRDSCLLLLLLLLRRQKVQG